MSVAATEMSMRYGKALTGVESEAAYLFHRLKHKDEGRGWDDLPEEERVKWMMRVPTQVQRGA